MGAKRDSSEQLFNRNLTALVAVIFLFYGGLSCLYSVFVPHLIHLGFETSEIGRMLTIVALVSILGPLIFAPLIDLIADRKKGDFGRYLQYILALLLILGSIAYSRLLVVPTVERTPVQNEESITFGCNMTSAVIFQRKCAGEQNCHDWDGIKNGDLELVNCSYTCQEPEQYKDMYHVWVEPRPNAEKLREQLKEEVDPDVIEDYDINDSKEKVSPRQRRAIKDAPYVEPPHICTQSKANPSVIERCQVYTKDIKSLKIHDVTLHSAVKQEHENESLWCSYPVDGLQCNIPTNQSIYMKKLFESCVPTVECKVLNPFKKSSPLVDNQCYEVVGDFEETYWSYLLTRSIADIFPVAIIVLLNTAVIIATRETSSGRSEIGRQLAWGALAWSIFPLIFGLCGIHGEIFVPVITCIVLWTIAALILIFTRSIPLSPPEWWWQIYTGDFMAIPLSAIRKYTPEIIALSFVAIVLGAFWSIIDTYQPPYLLDLHQNVTHLQHNANNATNLELAANLTEATTTTTAATLIDVDVNGNPVEALAPANATQNATINAKSANEIDDGFALGAPKVIKFAMTAAAIPAIFILWNAEKIVDYCGHANVLIAAFALHIIRFTALAYFDAPWYALLTHSLESITLVLVFVTLVLYMRHLVPRRLITCGQSVPVIATLCIGNAIGTLVAPWFDKGFKSALFEYLAIISAIVGCSYFILYHGYLGKRCAAAQQQPPSPQDLQQHNSSQQPNGASNGNSYTPLRIYHNARGRKGHFRY